MATQTSKTSRPAYLQNMISGLTGQIDSAQVGDYRNRQYAGFNENQNQSLQALLNGGAVGNYASQVIGAGQEGVNTLNDVYSQIRDLYSQGNISADQVNNLANQLYSSEDAQEAIAANNAQLEQQAATETNPQIAQQLSVNAGMGSMNRLAKDRAAANLATNEQNEASQITSNMYNNAMSQAQSILTSNNENRRSALGALASSASNQAGLVNQGALMAQQGYTNSLNTIQQQMQNSQNELDNSYNNSQMAQNWQYNQINNQLNAASVLNGALGTKTITTSSGGGGGMLSGAASGAAAGSAFGPWGALAGAAIGAVASSQSS